MTTDNGSNVKKCNEILRRQVDMHTQSIVEGGVMHENPSHTDIDVEAYNEVMLNILEEENASLNDTTYSERDYVASAYVTTSDEDDEHNREILTVLNNSFLQFGDGDGEPLQYIHGNLCGAHTLQLEVNRSIQCWNSRTKLHAKCRLMTDKLRSQNIRDELNRRKLKIPRPDCITRWNSSYIMVNNIWEGGVTH